MKIAILGAGNVGAALGHRFAEIGHDVFFGARNPRDEKSQTLVGDIGERAQVGTVAEAAKDADMVLLAVPYDAVADAVRECGDLNGKTLIDATNPLEFVEGSLRLSIGFESSGAEQVAKLAPGASVVKCFNQTGFGNMTQPRFGNRSSVMFVCGDDRAANEEVRALAEAIGFEAIDAGKLEVARLLEPLAMLWIHLAFTTDLKRDFAFALMRKI